MTKLLLFFVYFLSMTSYPQMKKEFLPKQGTVNGKIIDNISKAPLPYVNIVIKNTEKAITTGGITDDNGIFKIKNIPLGTYAVEIQFIGFKTVKKDINLTNATNSIDLGTIALEEDSAILDEVEIRAETSTIVQKVDRKVINVGKDLTSAGTTASELLNNVQSVSVDSQTGNISLRGNENVRVLVDGKPTNIPANELLKQIPSTSIKSVELITNPSAKYNPEGMSGIINIVLNKNANIGFNGSINSGVTAGHYVRYNASTNMNYKTGKVNFFGNYGYNGGDNFNFGFINRPTVNNQDFVFKNLNQSHLLKLGADIYLNDKNTLSFYTTQNWFNGGGNGSVKVYDTTNTLTFNAPNYQNQDNKSETYNVNYTTDFNKDGSHNLEFEVTYSNNKTLEDAENKNLINNLDDFDFSVFNYTNDIVRNRDNTLINLDYTNPISEKGKLELGLEYRTNTTDNTNTTDQQRYLTATEVTPIGNSTFDYDRYIYSGYVNYSHQFKKITMQLGARLEQYDITGNFTGLDNLGTPETTKVTDDIFSIYPSAFITYKSSDKNQFQISYSRRVDRPSIQQVNPIREWSTPLITSIGNANLIPQFTNSFEVNYTRKIKGGSITLGTFYRHINDVISRVTYADPASPEVQQILSFTNFDDTDAYGIELSSNYKIAKWWRTNASLDFYSQKQFGNTNVSNPNAERLEVQNTVFNARISNSFTASKHLKLQLFAMYRGPQKDIQWDADSMAMVNLGSSYTILKGKGSLSFRVNDIFNTMKFKFDSTTPFVQNGRFKWESRTAYLGFNYRFGGGKNKAKSRRNRDANEKQGGGFF